MMLTNKAWLRFSTALAVTGVLGAQLLPPPAFAQPAPPVLVPDAGAPVQTADPPARAGRLARIFGTVSFHPEGADRWDRAVLNYPVTNGYAFWTEPNAQADIEVAASRIVLDSLTQMDINIIDEQTVAATVAQGQIYLRLRGLLPGETYTVRTPRGTVAMRENGRYEIASGDTASPTRVTVLEGAAQVTGPNVALNIGPNQTGLIEGTDAVTTRVVGAQIDRFLQAQIDRERPPPRQAVGPPPQVQAMPGGEELASYGTWERRQEYGQVWYPRVAANWAPYRDGHWAWVAPWGWTWVDDQPWGFAPSHYGRWVEIDSRWAWSPGNYGSGVVYAPPVYAPAMVSFFDVGAAAVVGGGIGLAIGAFASGGIGWIPLGWQEPYRPWYNVTNNYYRNVNISNVTNVNVTNITNTTNNITINNFANRHAMTAVPTAAMATSANISRVAQRVDPAQFGNAQALVGRQPLQPTTNTLGVSTGMARRMNLQGEPGGAGVSTATNRPPAPGPTLSPASNQSSAQGPTGRGGPAPPFNGGGDNSNPSRLGGGQEGPSQGQSGPSGGSFGPLGSTRRPGLPGASGSQGPGGQSLPGPASGGQGPGGPAPADLGQRGLGQGSASQGPQHQGRFGQDGGGQGGLSGLARPGGRGQMSGVGGGAPGPAITPRSDLGQGLGGPSSDGQKPGGPAPADLGQRGLGQGSTSQGPQHQGRFGQDGGSQGGLPPLERPGGRARMGGAGGGAPSSAITPHSGLGQGIGTGTESPSGPHLGPQGSGARGFSSQGQGSANPGYQRLTPQGSGPNQRYVPQGGGGSHPQGAGGSPAQSYTPQAGGLSQRNVPQGSGSPAQAYSPQGGDPSQRYAPQGGGSPAQAYTPQGGRPSQRYAPQGGGESPAQAYTPQGGGLSQRYAPHGGGGSPAQAYTPQGGGPSQRYAPQGGGGSPAQAYTPQGGGPSQRYAPQGGGESPAQAYAPQRGGPSQRSAPQGSGGPPSQPHSRQDGGSSMPNVQVSPSSGQHTAPRSETPNNRSRDPRLTSP